MRAMSEPKKPATKSAAHRFGFVACPSCNPAGKPSGEISTPCAWCWSNEDSTHRRFVLSERAKEWARSHGVDDDDIPTSPESRDALLHPPKLDAIPDTEPAPSAAAEMENREHDDRDDGND